MYDYVIVTIIDGYPEKRIICADSKEEAEQLWAKEHPYLRIFSIREVVSITKHYPANKSVSQDTETTLISTMTLEEIGQITKILDNRQTGGR